MARKGKGSDPIGKHAKHGSAPLPGDSAEEQRAAQRVVCLLYTSPSPRDM